ncbi:DUF1566 domain-containing protein [Vibrio cholerae]|uniref:DUF1566 domain-containing protein n=1 Tax=Vibrio cholerae TaxID=666 RepID=UPI000893D9A1|nr:DUF1566 domain-containing protein [Vibrio cholerae]OFI69948.1 hypothetical protein BFX16_00920 [Vibrio cholerae]OFI70318.1 hypothetical protein BFX15_00920 [Vibrio cholerae]
MNYSLTLMALLVAPTCLAQQMQVCLPNADLNPNQRFSHAILSTDMGDYKVVNDAATGLQWSYCLVGQTLNADQINCDGQPVVPYDVAPVEKYKPNIREKVLDALYTEKQKLGTVGANWRLPNAQELLSIYNERCYPNTYPAFHYSLGMTEEEIRQLASIRIDWKLPDAERNALAADQARGKAYKGIYLTTDSAQPGDDYFYYAITFREMSSPFVHGNNPGMLRMVRPIPTTP